MTNKQMPEAVRKQRDALAEKHAKGIIQVDIGEDGKPLLASAKFKAGFTAAWDILAPVVEAAELQSARYVLLLYKADMLFLEGPESSRIPLINKALASVEKLKQALAALQNEGESNA